MPIMRINVGPIHPSAHGVLRLVVDVDGDTIVNVEPHVGFLHRGVEKLMETRMYMQNPSYTEKIDYVAPFSWDEFYVSAVEAAAGIEVKEPAQYARVILLEFQRIASHLLWLGTFVNDLGQMFTIFMWAFRERAKVIKLMEDVSGGRMFHVNLRLGGFNHELPPDFKERVYALLDYLQRTIPSYKDLLDNSGIFVGRTQGVGVLGRSEALNLGATGPVLRASGIDYDIRKASPYYIYDKLSFTVPVMADGDSYSRYRVRYEEMMESLKIIKQALDTMPDGSVLGAPIKLAGPPVKTDTVFIERELPRGSGLIYMVPDKQKPYRIATRPPSFINMALLPHLAKGSKFADLFAILGSLDIVVPEVDK